MCIVTTPNSIRAIMAFSSAEVFARGFELSEIAERELRARKSWEILSPAQMATVCFRFGNDDDFQTHLVDVIMRDGYALLTSTTLRGAASLRLCTINPRTTEQDIIATVERLDKFARDLGGGSR